MCSISNKVEEFLKKQNLTRKEEPFLIGFSGGADSLCLLNILHSFELNITAIHLNHNWRGEESLKDYENCKNFCMQKGIPFYSETLSSSIPHTETAAREARYKFFKKCAEKFGSKVVFTAHNADDNAETLIYRIIKGTGTEGLIGIAQVRDIFYRPLLNICRKEIEEYCKNHNLLPNNDSSNYDTKYNRNFIRHEILPLMQKINKDTISAINSLSKTAKEDSEILTTYIQKIKLETGNSTAKFIQLSNALQNRIVYGIYKENNLDYDREKILKTVKFINESAKSKSGRMLSITTDLWLFASWKEFLLIRQVQKSSDEIVINQEGSYEFDNFIFSLKKADKFPAKFPPDSTYKAYVQFSNIDFTLRYRHDGDIINPLGAGGSQKLKKYFNTKKIPNYQKDLIPLLCSGNEVLWAAGYGISEKIKVENGNIYMLELTNKEDEGYGN